VSDMSSKQEAIERLRTLVSEIWTAHRDCDDPGYNECDDAECTWCEDTRKALEVLAAETAPDTVVVIDSAMGAAIVPNPARRAPERSDG